MTDFDNFEKSKKPKKNRFDPFAAREAQKYENPIPSREFLLAYIQERGKPLSFRHLAIDLELIEDSKEALRRRLKAMERDGQLVKNRKGAYGLIGNMGLVKGRFSAHRDGYGFVIPSQDDGAGDLYINNREAGAVFHDDEVVAKVTGIDAKGRREGIIIEVTQRNTTQVVGRYFKTDRVGVVEPAGKIKKTILIPEKNNTSISELQEPYGAHQQLRVKDGQFVLINIIQQPTKHTQALGEIVQILGDHMAPGMETDVAIHSYQLPNDWSPQVLKELEQISDQVEEQDFIGRKDLRALPLVTIDGEDSRDFDDAVYCQAVKQGWRLYVAIADVSHYVKPGTELDKEAFKRGTSVYFPNKVIPMLPEKLSNGLCSLNPRVDRLCMVADMLISKEGKISRSNFYPAEWQVDSPTTTHRVTQHSPRYPASSTTRRTTIVAQAPHQTRQGLTREQQLARNTLQQQRHLDETTTNNNLHQYNDTFEKFKNAYKAGEDPLSFSKQFEQHRQYFEERWQIKITPSDFLCCSTTYELLNIPCLIPNSTKPYDLNSIIKSKKANENFFKDPNSRKTFNHNQITGDDYRATFIESMLTELHQLYHQLNPPEATTTLITSNVIEKLNNIDGLRVTNLTIVLHQAHHATLYSKTGANSENVTDQQTTHGKEALSKPHI